MQTLADFAKRLAALEAIVNNLEQVGIVTAVHAEENLLDIEVRGVVLAKVPYMQMRAGTDGKTYWVPEVGESGIVFCPGGNVGNAIFLAGLNTEANPAPDSDPKVMHRIFEPNIFEKYDGNKNEHLLSIEGDPTRTTNPDKIEDKLGTSVNKIDNTETEIKRTAGIVHVIVGTTRLEISSTAIKGFIAGIGKIAVTAGSVNVNGATFLGATTNLSAVVGGVSSAGVWPVTYVAVPIV